MPCWMIVHAPSAARTKPWRYSEKPSCTATLSTLATRRLVAASASPSTPRVSPSAMSSPGVFRDCLPRPPQTKRPISRAIGARPRFSAPRTLVVIPDECQSMPITQPSDWNQNGWASRRSTSARPNSRSRASTRMRPSRSMRTASHGGTRPPWSGRSALPVRRPIQMFSLARGRGTRNSLPTVNVLFTTAELAPFAKTGGLADVSAALPRHLRRLGHDVRVFLPFYAKISAEGRRFETVDNVQDVEIALGVHRYRFSLFATRLPGSDLDVFLVRCPELYGRPSIYTSDPDEHRRFLLLCRAAFESAQRMRFAPDVVHCNDWQTALAPLYLRARYSWDPLFARTKSLFTVHNLAYQGVFPSSIVPDTGLLDSRHLFHQDDLNEGRLNFLLTAILYADGITTVSPSYSREIQTAEQGAGLDGLLRIRSERIVGILNGVDYGEWSPESDAHIPYRYSAIDLDGKAKNKEALLRAMRLGHDDRAMVAGIVSRLA